MHYILYKITGGSSSSSSSSGSSGSITITNKDGINEWWYAVWITESNGLSVWWVTMTDTQGISVNGVKSAEYGYWAFQVTSGNTWQPPFDFVVGTSAGKARGLNIIWNLYQGTSATIYYDGSAFTEDEEDGNDVGVTTWIAMGICVFVVIGCMIIGLILVYKRKKSKGDVTFDENYSVNVEEKETNDTDYDGENVEIPVETE